MICLRISPEAVVDRTVSGEPCRLPKGVSHLVIGEGLGEFEDLLERLMEKREEWKAVASRLDDHQPLIYWSLAWLKALFSRDRV